jgi:hypothetical protein
MTAIAKPGSTWGPCLEPCDHYDCAANRYTAAQPCAACGEPIGFDTPYFFTIAGEPKHLACLERSTANAR